MRADLCKFTWLLVLPPAASQHDSLADVVNNVELCRLCAGYL